MKEALIIGAGRLGKGFVGETLANAPAWKTTFIDKDTEVIRAMREAQGYDVRVHRVDRIDDHHVCGYDAYTWKDSEALLHVVDADLILFVIYPEEIPEAIESMKQGLKLRRGRNPGKNVTMIFITNKNHMMKEIEQLFLKRLNEEEQLWFRKRVVLRDSIVRRSTDAKSNRALKIRTTAVLSLLIQGPVNVDFTDVEWLEVTDQLELLKDVKVFIVNGPHAASAFMGHYMGYETINEISADPEGATFIAAVNAEIKAGILKQYPLSEQQLDDLSLFPKAKGEMVDEIYRVAFDPIRKLSKGDRLAGSALMCQVQGVSYDHIAKAMAYGFLYDNPKDAQAVKLQKRIQKQGIEAVVEDITGFTRIDEVAQCVLRFYQELKK